MEPKVKLCPVCGKPTEGEIAVFGKTITVGIMCDCKEKDAERQKAMLEESRKTVERNRIKELFCDVSKRDELLLCTFDKDDGRDKKVSRLCENYAKTWDMMKKENIGLVLWGNSGTGKTFYSLCIANHLMENLVKVLFTSIPEILVKPMEERNGFIRRMSDYDLIILDDVGTERRNPYTNEILNLVVDSRYSAKKPIIITTNYTENEIRNPSDIANARIFERIEEMCIIVKCTGDSRRKELSQEKRKKAIGLLYRKE